jgi:hypothetical protein
VSERGREKEDREGRGRGAEQGPGECYTVR